MPAFLILAAAMAASPAAPTVAVETQARGSGIAASGQATNSTEAEISRILASGQVQQGDPAALINLGAAYARLGQKDRALAMFRAAIASPDRYDLQLSDGRWMDSRAAARLAATALERGDRLVMR
jgi:hypothetical protein